MAENEELWGNLENQKLARENTRTFTIEGIKYRSYTPSFKSCPKDLSSYGYKCDINSFRSAMIKLVEDDLTTHINNFKQKYIESTLAQLLYNNPHIKEYSKVKNLFCKWILNWKGNDIIKYHRETEEIIDNFAFIIGIENIRKYILFYSYGGYMYPESIEEISDFRQRANEKLKFRTIKNREHFLGEIIEASQNHQNKFFGILPTVKNIERTTTQYPSYIRKHGKGYFISANEQTALLVQVLKKKHPNLSLNEFKALLGETYQISLSKKAIKKYWD